MPQNLDRINEKIKRLEDFLFNEDLLAKDNTIRIILPKFMKLKEIIGNIDMDIHFLASYLANSFLANRHGVTIDMTKAVGSSGMDIEIGQVVAEIKTTIPYLENDFGARQKETIRKDLERLENADKKHKYFFVTDDRTEEILKRKYGKNYPSVEIVNLLNE